MFKAVQKIFSQGCLSIPYFVDFKDILLQVLFQKLKSRAARSFFIVGEGCGGGGGEESGMTKNVDHHVCMYEVTTKNFEVTLPETSYNSPKKRNLDLKKNNSKPNIWS